MAATFPPICEALYSNVCSLLSYPFHDNKLTKFSEKLLKLHFLLPVITLPLFCVNLFIMYALWFPQNSITYIYIW